MCGVMKLAQWLENTKTTQDQLGIKTGLTQGRISQIVAKGTRDLATAKRIEDATDKAVRVADLIPAAWRKVIEATGAAE